MSRIGQKPIPFPTDVAATVSDGAISIQGPKGTLSLALHRDVSASVSDNVIRIVLKNPDSGDPAIWGLFRSLTANMVEGVTRGFEKRLEIEGIGYRVALERPGVLALRLGFSHPVTVNAPDGITFAVDKNTIAVSGIHKELVGNVAAKIRKLRPPEPYKGKGIRYAGEVIRRKAGKKAVSGGS
ncbi:MAG: 50S ribosomal protein L6 [Patescibacteria group bacterium]